jgi:5'-nucleotidase
MIAELGPRRYAAEGSPADCVLAGLHDVLTDTPPDLVLSGVNRGNNAAENVLYSGTIGGALEAALQGLPAIALSQYYGPANAELENSSRRRPSTARMWCASFWIRATGTATITASSTTSTSRPSRRRCARHRVTAQGFRRGTGFGMKADTAPNGRRFLWITGGPQNVVTEPGTDAHANLEGYISVTPMRADLTAHDRARGSEGRAGMTGDDEATRKMQFLFQLRQKGVTDTRVLQAMEKIDRGAFVKGHFADRAYEDMPLPISCGQTISQPSVVGLMTQALDVQPRDKVLEIGTGSGYQAAVLSQLARRVYTIDRHRSLTREAEVFHADGPFQHHRADRRWQFRPARSGTLRPHPGDGRGRGPAGAASGATQGGRDHGRAGGPVRHGAKPDPRHGRTEAGYDYDELLPVRFVPLVEGIAEA